MRASYLAIALLAIPCSATSPYAWAKYYAQRRTFPVNIDGNLSEWKNVPGFTMDKPRFFYIGQGMSAGKWRGPRDLSANFKIIWDDIYVYIAVHVRDDKVTEPHGSLVSTLDTGSWDDDGIELMFDNDDSNMSRYYIGDQMHHEFHFVFSEKHPFVFDNFWKYKQGAPQPMFTLPDGRVEALAYPNEVMAKNDITEIFANPPYDGKFAFRRVSDGYNFELRIHLPGAKMRAMGDRGRRIGFDIAINDNDAGKGPLKQQLHWSGTNGMFWRDTSLFGSLFLIAAPAKK